MKRINRVAPDDTGQNPPTISLCLPSASMLHLLRQHCTNKYNVHPLQTVKHANDKIGAKTLTAHPQSLFKATYILYVGYFPTVANTVSRDLYRAH